MDIGQFIKQLRSALNRLYDLDYLRHNPLAELFSVAGRFITPLALQRILTDSIETLHPSADLPINSQAWRTYNILLYRYIQQLSVEEVAAQLGISLRQFGREQAIALEVLACKLWEKYPLEDQADASTADQVKTTAETQSDVITDDLNWLKAARIDRPMSFGAAYQVVSELAEPLAEKHHVLIQSTVEGKLPGLLVHPVALRQILLSLLNAAIAQTPGGEVHVNVQAYRGDVEVSIWGEGAGGAPARGTETGANLETLHTMVALSQAKLEITPQAKDFRATLTLPVSKSVPILAIDDNQDILQLFQRFTTGTRYDLIGTGDPAQVYSLVETYSPEAILLDIMMPEMDGWQLLGRLRQHPLTSHIPIVICSILGQEELAYSLGASGYIHKPVTRQNLLESLDRIAVALG